MVLKHCEVSRLQPLDLLTPCFMELLLAHPATWQVCMPVQDRLSSFLKKSCASMRALCKASYGSSTACCRSAAETQQLMDL